MSIAVAHDDHQDDGEMLRLLRDAAATFAKRSGVGRSRALRNTRPGFDRATWKQMAEQGWLGILIPRISAGRGSVRPRWPSWSRSWRGRSRRSRSSPVRCWRQP